METIHILKKIKKDIKELDEFVRFAHPLFNAKRTHIDLIKQIEDIKKDLEKVLAKTIKYSQEFDKL